ncbi:hypothetical protein ACLOJK_041082 [Asimina triloba]
MSLKFEAHKPTITLKVGRSSPAPETAPADVEQYVGTNSYFYRLFVRDANVEFEEEYEVPTPNTKTLPTAAAIHSESAR